MQVILFVICDYSANFFFFKHYALNTVRIYVSLSCIKTKCFWDPELKFFLRFFFFFKLPLKSLLDIMRYLELFQRRTIERLKTDSSKDTYPAGYGGRE